jgi:hypothetical protein
MGGGGDKLEITGEERKDPATMEREKALWDQTTAYAAEQPFSSQYGGPTAMPGMGQMSQAGQKYLTDAILGPGQYQAQDLGFTDYQAPDQPAPIELVTEESLATKQRRNLARLNEARAAAAAGVGAGAGVGAAGAPREGEHTEGLTAQQIEAAMQQQQQLQQRRQQEQAWLLQQQQGQQQQQQGLQQPVVPHGLVDESTLETATADRGELQAAMQTRRSDLLGMQGRLRDDDLGYGGYDIASQQAVGSQPVAGLLDTRTLEEAARGTARPYSPTVGVRSMQEAGDVTRRMLRETEPTAPGYDRFLPESTDPVTGTVTPAGWREQAQAGIGETPGFTRDETGNLVPIEGFGFAGAELGGPTYDDEGNVIPGYRPTYDAIRGQVTGEGTDAVRATPFGVDAPDAFTFGSLDAEGQPRVGPGGLPVGDIPAVTQGLIVEQEGYGETAYDKDELALTDAQRKLSQIGQAARPGQVYDPLTETYTTAAVAERIADPTIAGLGQFQDPATGELTDVMTPGAVTIDPVTGQTTADVAGFAPTTIGGPQGVTVDPVTGQATTAVGGVAPGEFGGASFLGGPAIQDYMNQAGTEAAVTQARQDYEIALNREKARQAQVGAFGARGTVEEAGLIEAQERNIASIRGAGFERAAQMMEADAARRQQAGLQTQQLGAQTGLAGQALEAQRRESDAARAQQAAMQGQQLGFQGQLQTQQLAQAGDIRGAELGLQAGLQGQQLQAQRREADAARAQQAALAGQQLGTQALMQTQQLGFQGGMQAQQLGQQANIRQAELEMEGARANQATALASGSQTQQLQASREMRQAELNLQRQQQTQQLGLQAGMQQAGFGQQAAVRQAELDLQREQATQGLGAEAFMQQQQLGQQAAMATASNALESARADQQAALASGNQAAALEAQRRAQGAQAQIDIASRTQALGAGAAAQQAQLEATRRQRLSEMGLQAGGMGLDAQAQFRQQQMGAAQQLADVGGMRQGAAFGAAGQLAGMGAQQEQAQRAQMAFDYEQWLRGLEGGAESLALTQSMMPGGQQWQYGRKPSVWGQIGGGLLAGAGLASDIYRTSKMPGQ